jgi:lysine N6-hydroxylase
MADVDVVDLLGIGIGPSNLSLAALLQPLRNINSCFCDARERFDWHPGLMFPEANIQVSFLKDLVTLADPASPFSFVSFLHAHKRLYRFITANLPRISRIEFNQYLNWVCSSLQSLKFGCPIEEVRHDGKVFTAYQRNCRRRARNLVLGTGLSPVIPDCARKYAGRDSVFVALEYLHRKPEIAGLRIAVIGGGQTSAEIVLRLLGDLPSLPREIIWISRRSNFCPLDESPFANELFTPAYSAYFHSLKPGEKSKLLAEHKLASDGISLDLLETIYRRLYAIEFLHKRGRICTLRPGCRFEGMEACGREWMLTIKNAFDGQPEAMMADVVILCTGFEYKMPEFLCPLSGRIHWTEDGYCVRRDFSIEWDGPSDQKVYVQNAARRQRGIADPNLSLMAWRSATIINSMMKRQVYDVDQASSMFDLETTDARKEAVGGVL